MPAITSGIFLSAGECILPKVYTRLAAHRPAADRLWHHSAASTIGSQRRGCTAGLGSRPDSPTVVCLLIPSVQQLLSHCLPPCGDSAATDDLPLHFNLLEDIRLHNRTLAGAWPSVEAWNSQSELWLAIAEQHDLCIHGICIHADIV